MMLNLSMFGNRLAGSLQQGHQLVILEEVRRFVLHNLQYFHRQLANLYLSMAAAPQLDEMPQRSRVGGHENLCLRRVRQDAAGSLAGELATQRPVRLSRELLLQQFRQAEVRLMALGD